MYAFFYFPIATLLKLTLILAVVNRFKRAVSPVLAFFVSILYIFGMYRSAGIDITHYRRNYDDINISDISDPGYNLLMFISNSIGLPFESFLLTIGFLNLMLIRFCCVRLKVNFGIVLAILALHLFLVRDFSQFRIGLAVNFVIAGFLSTGKIRYIFYTLGASFHFTSLILVGLFYSYNFQKNKRILIKAMPLVFVFFVGFSVSYLTFLDPRIDIYLNWDREGYGQSITNYNQVFLLLFFLSVSLYRSSFQMDVFVYSFVYSLIVFIAFSHAAIFSYRLANVCMSLYPYLFAKILNSSSAGIFKLGSIATIIFVFSLREKNNSVIESIVLGFQ